MNISQNYGKCLNFEIFLRFMENALFPRGLGGGGAPGPIPRVGTSDRPCPVTHHPGYHTPLPCPAHAAAHGVTGPTVVHQASFGYSGKP